jgi:hypothetical protein
MRFFRCSKGKGSDFEISEFGIEACGDKETGRKRDRQEKRQTGMSVLLDWSDREYGMGLVGLLPLVAAQRLVSLRNGKDAYFVRGSF